MVRLSIFSLDKLRWLTVRVTVSTKLPRVVMSLPQPVSSFSNTIYVVKLTP